MNLIVCRLLAGALTGHDQVICPNGRRAHPQGKVYAVHSEWISLDDRDLVIKVEDFVGQFLVRVCCQKELFATHVSRGRMYLEIVSLSKSDKHKGFSVYEHGVRIAGTH